MRSLGFLTVFAACAIYACAGSESVPDFGGSTGGTDAGTDGSGAKAGQDAGNDVSSGATDGTPCKVSSECANHWCVDGVCCEASCDGLCRTCSASGKEGKCTLIAAGSDPELECSGAIDGGDASPSCAGKCDGTGSCAYPSVETSCGSASCADGKQTSEACDGAGACKTTDVLCGFFQCGPVTCLTSCVDDKDCTSDGWCDNGKCEAKKPDGGSCVSGKECTSDVCVSGTCCNVACDAPASCTTGQCLCNGDACATGDTCITWFLDSDGDGFGDSSKPALGCSSTGPTGGLTYAKNGDDCYDKNPNAKPNQQAYFTTERGDGSFDYNCNNAPEYQYGNISGLSCGDCGLLLGGSCLPCGSLPNLYTYGFGCNSANKCTFTGYKQGYDHVVTCGDYGNLWSCDQCTTNEVQDSQATQQGCH